MNRVRDNRGTGRHGGRTRRAWPPTGFGAGPNQSVRNPLGEGGTRIHDWAFRLKGFRELHGDAGGGETGTNDDMLREASVDEMEAHVVPLLLGDGARLFDGLGNSGVKLEPIRTIEGPGVTHLKYRVVRQAGP